MGVPGFEDYSIQTIATIISSTDDHVLYKGVMFMSKDELKTILGRLVLKEKVKYRIRRLSMTCFEASYKDISCKFQLRAVGIQRVKVRSFEMIESGKFFLYIYIFVIVK